jgi:microcystin-dependent protein
MQVFLGSLILVPYNFAPLNYAFCQGQLLNISSNTALFALLGMTFGGNGTSNFGLPNLQGSHAIGQGQGAGLNPYNMGQTGGSTTVTLTSQTTPAHSHQPMALDRDGNSASPTNCLLSKPTDSTQIYTTATTPIVAMQAQSVQSYGGNGPNVNPHNNMMPFATLNWVIALQGIFPPRN